MGRPYDWTDGKCKTCRKFVRDGHGMQEQHGNEIERFCWPCYQKRCDLPAPASADRAKPAENAGSLSPAHAATG